jgi:hypothetical protein
MGFNLSRPAKKIHAEVEVVIDDETCRIMGVFTPLATNAAIDRFIRTLRTLEEQFEASPEFGLMGTIESMAREVFSGWVNPPQREDLWVVSGEAPVDCSPEALAAFLSIPGVAMAICQQYVDATSEKSPALGNSEPSPVSGAPPAADKPSVPTTGSLTP